MNSITTNPHNALDLTLWPMSHPLTRSLLLLVSHSRAPLPAVFDCPFCPFPTDSQACWFDPRTAYFLMDRNIIVSVNKHFVPKSLPHSEVVCMEGNKRPASVKLLIFLFAVNISLSVAVSLRPGERRMLHMGEQHVNPVWHQHPHSLR